MNNIDSLKWQIAMGVDENIEEYPVDRISAPKKPAVNAGFSEAAASIEAKSEKVAVNIDVVEKIKEVASSDAVVIANESLSEMAKIAAVEAAKCNNIEELEVAINSRDWLSIKRTATNTVFADGNPEAEIMFIGEAPNSEEDISGVPFSGESGQLLRSAISHIGLESDKNCYTGNMLFWRPPGNRKPTNEEIQICKPFVEKHIALVKPKIIILIGGVATTTLLDIKTGITKLRKEGYKTYKNDYMEGEIIAVPMVHPSFLIRQPKQKRAFWQDLLLLEDFLDKNKIKF